MPVLPPVTTVTCTRQSIESAEYDTLPVRSGMFSAVQRGLPGKDSLRTVLQNPGMFQMYSIVEVLPSELSEGLLLDLFESDSIERTMLTRFYTFCDEYR